MKKNKRQEEHDSNVSKLANIYGRSFNAVAAKQGVDLPMSLIVKLVELFADAIYTGEALERDYGADSSVNRFVKGQEVSHAD